MERLKELCDNETYRLQNDIGLYETTIADLEATIEIRREHIAKLRAKVREKISELKAWERKSQRWLRVTCRPE